MKGGQIYLLSYVIRIVVVRTLFGIREGNQYQAGKSILSFDSLIALPATWTSASPHLHLS